MINQSITNNGKTLLKLVLLTILLPLLTGCAVTKIKTPAGVEMDCTKYQESDNKIMCWNGFTRSLYIGDKPPIANDGGQGDGA